MFRCFNHLIHNHIIGLSYYRVAKLFCCRLGAFYSIDIHKVEESVVFVSEAHSKLSKRCFAYRTFELMMPFDDLGDAPFAKVVAAAENPGESAESIVLFIADVATEVILEIRYLFVHLEIRFTILIYY